MTISFPRSAVGYGGANVRAYTFAGTQRARVEDATAHSGQRYLCAINGACAGGGYELALAAEPVQKQLGGRDPKKVIVVPGRLVNIVG